jgi:hypothetical protein
MDFDAEIKRLEDGIKQMQEQAQKLATNIVLAQGALLQTKALKTQHEEQCKDCGLKTEK